VQRVEVSVFLCLILPAVLLSLLNVEQRTLTFPIVTTATIVHNLTLLMLVFFFIWRNGESFASLGLTFANSGREIAIGIGLFIPFVFGISLFEMLLHELGFVLPDAPPRYLIPIGNAQYLLAFAFLVVVAVSEEAIFRGYLMLRLHAVTGSTAFALLLSSVIFAIGHGYQGSGGVLTVGLMGLLLALVYLWRGSLVAPITMHFLQNFIGIVLIPL
jgi:membrane protease YdiL (CAAX protease family)